MFFFDKQSMLKSFSSNEEKLLFSKVLDQVLLCLKESSPTFSHFLDPVRVSNYMNILQRAEIPGLRIMAYGKRNICERKIIGFFPEDMEPDINIFPISALKISYNSKLGRKLTHRDFLGSILGLGVDRTKVGDIFIEDSVICYVHSDISFYICANLEKVANTGVSVKEAAEDAEDEIEKLDSIENMIKVSVSSLRLDVIVSAVFKLSRSKSKALIEGEKVFVNWVLASNISRQINENDIITLRGYGRAKFVEITGKSKKDKYIIHCIYNH